MYVCMYVCMYVYVCIFIYVCICIYKYTRQAKVVKEVRLARLEQQIKSRMFARIWQEWRKMTRYESVCVIVPLSLLT